LQPPTQRLGHRLPARPKPEEQAPPFDAAGGLQRTFFAEGIGPLRQQVRRRHVSFPFGIYSDPAHPRQGDQQQPTGVGQAEVQCRLGSQIGLA
jgi:hypothetical protein